MSAAILLINCAVTFALTGVIWIVHRVHYPHLKFTDPGRFSEAHSFHTRRITPVVAPLMIVELFTAATLPFLEVRNVPPLVLWIGLALAASVWLSTFLVQVPYHRLLSAGRDELLLDRLIRSNRFRVAAWSIRSVIALAALFFAFETRL